MLLPGNRGRPTGRLRNILERFAGPNSVVTTHERLAMKKIKVHSLTGRITPPLMRQAFQAVKRNRGAAGVDQVSVKLFDANREENLAALMRDLKTGSFRPRPLRRVYIPKGPGSKKLRPLGIPVVRDRVAQEVIRRLLAPIFEPQFHESSYGFRPGRNCHQAIERVLELHRQGYHVVLDADVQGFFLSSRSRRMRDKSVQKFKAKIRELTVRKHNLDPKGIEKLNRVIRGTANYFAADFSTGRWLFQKLDSWIRMRLRCMKVKRKNYSDNRKIRAKYLCRKLGLLTLEEFCTYRDRHGQACRVTPRHGATSVGVAR